MLIFCLCLSRIRGLSQLFTLVLFIHFAVCRRRSMAAFEAGARFVRPLAVFTFRSVFCLSACYSCITVVRLENLQFSFSQLDPLLASYYFHLLNNHLILSIILSGNNELLMSHVSHCSNFLFLFFFYTQPFIFFFFTNYCLFNQLHSYTQFVNFLQPRARSLHSFFVMTHHPVGLSLFSSICLLFTRCTLLQPATPLHSHAAWGY